MGKHWWWLTLLFVPPYALVATVTYWLAIDRNSPLTLVYQHPRFLSQPATSREEAQKYSITEASVKQHLYVWREVCLKKAAPSGTTSLIWVEMNDATPVSFAWSAVQRAFHEREGCYSRSFGPILLPDAVGKTLDYRMTVDYDINPLRTARTSFPPIRGWILP